MCRIEQDCSDVDEDYYRNFVDDVEEKGVPETLLKLPIFQNFEFLSCLEMYKVLIPLNSFDSSFFCVIGCL